MTLTEKTGHLAWCALVALATASVTVSLSVLQVPQQAGGPLVSSISVFAKPDE
uniref:Uncharacterized protein n=1 Tax=Klebsiella pneumoniae TaxID=573 RepID=A0A6G9HPV1_KLEPN|nr:hypothetical protein [Klebsiella pneumoniae]